MEHAPLKLGRVIALPVPPATYEVKEGICITYIFVRISVRAHDQKINLKYQVGTKVLTIVYIIALTSTYVYILFYTVLRLP